MAWDQTKPANNSALTSSEVRLNWAALEAALGNPDLNPVSPAKPFQFPAAPTFKPGSDSAYTGTVSGRLTTNTSSVSNAGVAETDLMSYSLRANSLDVNGKAVRVRYWGTHANNANVKTLRVYFGATVALTVTLTPSVVGRWGGEFLIVRTGAATQITHARCEHGAAASNTVAQDTAAPGETLSGAVTIKVTGQSGTAGGDVTQLGLIVEVVG